MHRFGRWSYRSKDSGHSPTVNCEYILLTNTICAGDYRHPHPSRRSEIGPGLIVHNFCGIFILAKKIGHSCTVNQGVSVASIRGTGWPTIGNNVYLGAGCKVMGGVTIGDNVVVGANSLVIADVPSNCTVMGVPARIISREVASPYLKSAGRWPNDRNRLASAMSGCRTASGGRRKAYSIAMVAACPFPANHGSAASIREMSDTLSEMGHNVHIVTYPTGQEEIRVRHAKVRRTGPFRPEGNAKVGPSAEKFVFDFKLLQIALPRHPRKKEWISFTLITTKALSLVSWRSGSRVGRCSTMRSISCLMSWPVIALFDPCCWPTALARALDWFTPIFPDHITAVSPELKDWFVEHGVPRTKGGYGAGGNRAGFV